MTIALLLFEKMMDCQRFHENIFSHLPFNLKKIRNLYIYWISWGYPMRKIEIQPQNHLEIEGIEGFLVRKVTKFGNSAKVDCPKEYLGRTVYLVIV